jgi:protein ImuB
VVHAALAFTPAVALWGPQGLVLEVAGSLRLFGGAPALIDRLRAALAPLGHRLRLASAPTARGAALLARWRGDLAWGPHSRSLAALQAVLDDAPVALLAREPAQAELLQGMGVHSLGVLRQLPRAGLSRRLGPALLQALDQALGRQPEPLSWQVLPPRFDARIALFTGADNTAPLLAGAQVLLARLVAWAQAGQGRVAGFTLHLHHDKPSQRSAGHVPASTALAVALAQPSADAAHLQHLLAERLARLPLAAPVPELQLCCAGLVQAPAPNGELFPSAASQREGLARLLERLAARLGRQGVQRLVPVADHRPECATRCQPADEPLPPPPAPPTEPATQPLWLLPEPQPLGGGEAPPRLGGQPLALLAGPERLETGWWDGPPVLRDYFIAATPQGALVWLYRTRLPGPEVDNRWFLHGRFG